MNKLSEVIDDLMFYLTEYANKSAHLGFNHHFVLHKDGRGGFGHKLTDGYNYDEIRFHNSYEAEKNFRAFTLSYNQRIIAFHENKILGYQKEIDKAKEEIRKLQEGL